MVIMHTWKFVYIPSIGYPDPSQTNVNIALSACAQTHDDVVRSLCVLQISVILASLWILCTKNLIVPSRYTTCGHWD